MKCTYVTAELEFGVLVFVEGGKPENPENNPRSKDKNQQQTQSTCDARSARIEPGPQGWEASAVTSAPSLLSLNIQISTKTTTKTIEPLRPNLVYTDLSVFFFY